MIYILFIQNFSFDKNGKVIAVSNEKEEPFVGKVLTQDWVEKHWN